MRTTCFPGRPSPGPGLRVVDLESLVVPDTRAVSGNPHTTPTPRARNFLTVCRETSPCEYLTPTKRMNHYLDWRPQPVTTLHLDVRHPRWRSSEPP